MTTIIPAKDYLYMRRFCSNEQTRYYLNGVCVEPRDGHVMLVSTDGHQLGVMRLEQPDSEHETGSRHAAAFILANSKDLIRACKVGKREHAYIRCDAETVDVIVTTKEIDADSYQITIGPASPRVSFPAKSLYIDGTFPDWQRVVPTPGSARFANGRGTGGVNPQLLANFAADGSGCQAIAFEWSGDGPMLIANNDPRFIGVVMPLRFDLSNDEIAARRANILGAKPEAIKQAA